MYQTNQQNRLRSALLLGAASAAVVGLSVPAMAQDETTTETVVVTGSRIPQTGLYSTSPITAVGRQELKLTGSTTVENVLRQLPSMESDVDNEFTNNGSGGEQNADLRGLGPNRTLVLVDGKRVQPADTAGEVDLSQFPPGLVDHIEVYTGGASAVYGSDAVAGVINLILRKDFEGLELDSSYKQTDHGDGQTTDVNGLMGFSSADGRGNVTLFADFENRQPIFQGDRAYSAHALNSPFFSGCGTPATHFGGFCFGGSSSAPEGRFTLANGNSYFPSTGAEGSGTFEQCGTTATPACPIYNFAPVNYYMTPNTRYSFGATGHYQISPLFDFYTRLNFSDNYTPTQLAPTPIISTFDTNYGNPFLSDQERALLFPGCTPTTCDPNSTLATFGFRKRLVETGNRIDIFNRDAYQLVVGVKGDLGMGWSYDLSGQYGRTDTTQRLTGDAKFNNFQQGLLVGGTLADPVCLDPSNGCVPIDIFSQNNVSGAAAQFIKLSMDAITRVEQWDAQFNVSGDLGMFGLVSPWAKTPVGVAMGAEYRQEAAAFQPDDNLATGNDLGFGGSPPVQGAYNVSEGYGEIRVPVLEAMPFAELLQFEGAYRYSNYNLAGPVHTYKYSGEWQPVQDLRFRASFERAVRAPNINELFSAAGVSANPGKDPCSDLNGSAVGYSTTAALCEATGVPGNAVFSSGLECPAGQCTALIGGNPALKPEIADTRTIGTVITPTFLDGFSATIDYYNIKVDGFITGLPLQLVVNNCYDPAKNPTQDPNNPFCQLVNRNAQGQIFGEPVPPGGDVKTLNSNIGRYQVKGWDLGANYQSQFADWGLDPAWGGVAFNFLGTLQPKSAFQPAPDQNPEACAGKFGSICINSAPTPKWRHQMRVTWLSPGNDITLSVLWRHISGNDFDVMRFSGRNGSQPCGFNFCDPAGDDDHIPAFDWFDVSGTWDVGHGIELRAGVTNIFNKKPPLVDINLGAANVDSGNTFPSTYDAVGRFIFGGVTVKL